MEQRRVQAYCPRSRASGVHRIEEVGVLLGGSQLVEQELDGVDRAHRIEDAAQHIHLLELIRRHQELFLTRAGAGDVDGRERALIGNLAVEDQLRVTGCLLYTSPSPRD